MKASWDRVTGGKRERTGESATANRRGAVLKFIMPLQPCPGINKGGEPWRKGLCGKGRREGSFYLSI